MKKLLSGIIITTLMLSMVGCAPKETLKLNEKYVEYYDTKTNAPTKGIVIEYGETPSLEVKEYLSEEQSEEFLLNTTLTLHAIKDEEMVEEPMEVEDKLEVGDYYLVLVHEDNKIQLLVSVRDTKAPEFKDFKEELSYEEGTKDIDLKSLFTAEDLSETEILIEGEVDFNKVGEYKIAVIAKDLSDNETKKECTVKITEKPKQVVNAPSGGGSTSSGGSNSGGGVCTATCMCTDQSLCCNQKPGRAQPECYYKRETHVHTMPNPIEDVIATAYEYVGQTGIICSELIWKVFAENKWYPCWNNAYWVWDWSMAMEGIDIMDVAKVGDLLNSPNHVALITKIDGDNITVVEGGVGEQALVREHTFTIVRDELGRAYRGWIGESWIVSLERKGQHSVFDGEQGKGDIYYY